MINLLMILAVTLAPVKWIYVVDEAICNGCGNCLGCCPHGAISMVGSDAYIDPDLCTACGLCPNYCPRGAISREWYTGIENGSVEVSGPLCAVNPASGGYLVLSGAEPSADVHLTDLTGRLVISSAADGSGDASLDISRLSPGIYLLVSGGSSLALTIVDPI